ncbi:MAG: hypothetical protein AB7F88_07690 [Pyrinomonadaceae bacterium]
MARRTRALFLNARAAIEMAPKVASIMAEEMGFGNDWIETQVQGFQLTAAAYLCRPE